MTNSGAHSYGRLIPEIENCGFLKRRLKIVVDLVGNTGELTSLLTDLAILRDYLDDSEDAPCSLSLLADVRQLHLGFSKFRLEQVNLPIEILDDELRIQRIDKSVKPDVVSVAAGHKALNCVESQGQHCQLLSHEDLRNFVQVFVRGHDVAWSFEEPVKHAWLNVFFTLSDNVGAHSNRIFTLIQQKFVGDSDIVENARELLLRRMTQTLYSRDKLLFFRQQREFARRRGWKRQGFTLEVNYHLNCYYSLLWGGLDQLAMILKLGLKLHVDKRLQYSVTNPKFVGKILSVDRKIGELFIAKDFTSWRTLLAAKRHSAAHSDLVCLTKIYERPMDFPTKEEIEAEIEASLIYNQYKLLMGEDAANSYLRFAYGNKFIEKHNLATDKLATFKIDGKQAFCNPLEEVTTDLDNYWAPVSKALEQLIARDSGKGRAH